MIKTNAAMNIINTVFFIMIAIKQSLNWHYDLPQLQSHFLP